MRLRIACIAAFTCMALAAIGAPAAGAMPIDPPGTGAPSTLLSVPVTGQDVHNGKQFTGTYGIQGYTVRNGAVYAVGTLTGTLKNRNVNVAGVLMPASLTGSGSTTAAPALAAPAADPSCSILHLVLGPVNLNLLGLQITLGGGTAGDQPIVLDITGNTGSGNLLGNLLCGLTNSLNGGGLSALTNNLQQLTAVLTSLTSLLGSL